MQNNIFHIEVPGYDFDAIRKFYIEDLGFSSDREILNGLGLVINFGGHQVVFHQVENLPETPKHISPAHFGLCFNSAKPWQALLQRVTDRKIAFYEKPHVRYPNKNAEHHVFFLKDPSNNLIELKYYTHNEAIFHG